MNNSVSSIYTNENKYLYNSSIYSKDYSYNDQYSSSNNSFAKYKETKNLANKFLEITKTKDNYKNEYNCFSCNNNKYTKKLDDYIDDKKKIDSDNESNISFTTESTDFTTQNNTKSNYKYYSVEDFLNISKENENRELIKIDTTKHKLLKENTEMKHNEMKYINFIKDIQKLMSNNTLIDIPMLIELFKNNLYEIDYIKNFLKEIEKQNTNHDKTILYKGEEIISLCKYNELQNEYNNVKIEKLKKEDQLNKKNKQLEENNEVLIKYKKNIKNYEKEIKNYESIKLQLIDKSNNLNNIIKTNKEEIEKKDAKIKILNDELSKIKNEYKNKIELYDKLKNSSDNYMEKLKETISLLICCPKESLNENFLDEMNYHFSNDILYKHFKNSYSQGNIFNYIESLKENIIKKEKEINVKLESINLLKEQKIELTKNYENKKNEIIKTNNYNTQKLESKISDLNKILMEKDPLIKTKDKSISKLKSENENLKFLLNTLKSDISIKENIINSFNTKIKELTLKEKSLQKINDNYKETIDILKKKQKSLNTLNTHKDTINKSLKNKITLLDEQINNIKNENCDQLKHEIKLLKNNISRKDEIVITNKNKIKELTDNNEEYKKQLNNYKELDLFNSNKYQLLNEKYNMIVTEKNNLQMKNDKLSKVLKNISEYLLSKYKNLILGSKPDIIDNDIIIKKETKDEEPSFSYSENEIVEKIKKISENMLNIDFKDVININNIDKYTKSNDKKNKMSLKKKKLFQYNQKKKEFNYIIDMENFESKLFNYFTNLIELSSKSK